LDSITAGKENTEKIKTIHAKYKKRPRKWKIPKRELKIKTEQQVKKDVTKKEDHEQKLRSSCGKTDINGKTSYQITHLKQKHLTKQNYLNPDKFLLDSC
jgi:hypothetical protein